MFLSAIQGAEITNFDQEECQKTLSRIEKSLGEINLEIENLKTKLLGKSALEKLPLLIPQKFNKKEQDTLRKAETLYQKGEYSNAKQILQEIWESYPDDAEINFNLGLVYYRLNKGSLTRQFLEQALKLNSSLQGAATIREFLKKSSTVPESSKESKELKSIRIRANNLYKEAIGYSGSNLDYPKKLKLTLTTLDKLKQELWDKQSVFSEHALAISDLYASYEQLKTSLEILGHYEEWMQDKELPDGYHLKKLGLQEKLRDQEEYLKQYTSPSEVDDTIKTRLQKNLEELAIFGVQLQDFVQELSDKNQDFLNFTERLKEFNWGNKSSKHTLIFDRYQNILFSSPEGSLPIDKYQDVQGKKFFKDICNLWNQFSIKETGYLEIELLVHNRIIPYILLYTYVPKHEAFIVVKLPKVHLT